MDERTGGDRHERGARSGRRHTYGRRSDDLDERVTFGRKAVVIIVAVVNLFYFLGEGFLRGTSCL